ncbi:MAG: 16S rRNA (guanine(527)-N(7))-methyltransferase RsmG [Proteobacteria bacterium]|jgi:16S rRNA (guanine527-N7)-methyltransferase|nr:16S rRNA (guanine(527)-N(7))-methyltransferase RsmG [Alphaproteobacteria bacterium]NCC03614.1 16S rRNA (guanine(527)-N(7))-methyltransferase RsmG [Pseudomonadota bacterium]
MIGEREAQKALWRLLQVPYGTPWAVSHETAQARLTRYADLLKDWSARMNLVAPSTLPQLWQRHLLDSAQLLPLLPRETSCLVDMGSGAGFPGLVLAALGVPEVHLIESIGKKARFLEAVAADLSLNIIVHNCRLEAIRGLKADVVTARALTSLPDLLRYAAPFMGPSSVALFLKGEKAPSELTEARKYWTFTCEETPSLTAPTGVVLAICKLKAHKDHDPRRKHAKSKR